MNNHFLLRDSQENHGVFSCLESAYHFALQFTYNFGKYYKIMSCDDTNMLVVLSHFQILEYAHNEVVNMYVFSGTDLTNHEGNITKINTLMTQDLLNKITEVQEETVNSMKKDNLDIFIPHKEKSNSKTDGLNVFIPYNDMQNEKESLQKHIESLTALKSQKQNQLNTLAEKKYEEEQRIRIEKLKMEVFNENKKAEEEREAKKKEKFMIDRNLYRVFCNEIDTGVRDPDNIPAIFEDTFDIFEEMEAEDILEKTDSEQYAYYVKKLADCDTEDSCETVTDGIMDIFKHDVWRNKFVESHSDDETNEIIK